MGCAFKLNRFGRVSDTGVRMSDTQVERLQLAPPSPTGVRHCAYARIRYSMPLVSDTRTTCPFKLNRFGRMSDTGVRMSDTQLERLQLAPPSPTGVRHCAYARVRYSMPLVSDTRTTCPFKLNRFGRVSDTGVRMSDTQVERLQLAPPSPTGVRHCAYARVRYSIPLVSDTRTTCPFKLNRFGRVSDTGVRMSDTQLERLQLAPPSPTGVRYCAYARVRYSIPLVSDTRTTCPFKLNRFGRVSDTGVRMSELTRVFRTPVRNALHFALASPGCPTPKPCLLSLVSDTRENPPQPDGRLVRVSDTWHDVRH